MPVHAVRVFISAASRDLCSFRETVRTELDRKSVSSLMVVDWQEAFPTEHGTIPEVLLEKLRRADIIIHLAGFACGARLRVPVSGFKHSIQALYTEHPSYTQLEYLAGRDLEKRVITCIAMDPAELDPRPDSERPESPEDIALQKAHRDHLLHGDMHFRYEFNTRQDLAGIIKDLQIEQPDVPVDDRPCNVDRSLGTLFKGRDQFLTKLRDTLRRGTWTSGSVTAITSQAIHGLGGVGKTRSAIEYARLHREDYTALLLVRADSVENLETNFANLALVFKLEQENPTLQSRLNAVYKWLAEHPRWFLIIDNVDSPEAARAVKTFLDAEQLRSGDIVITTRLRNWNNHVTTLDLDVLDEKAAVEFLLEVTKNRPPRGDDEKKVKEMARILDGLALALEQAGAYIHDVNMSFADYVEAWREGPKELLDWKDEQIMLYPTSVARTLQLSIAKLDMPARALLGLLANLAPTPVERKLLKTQEAYAILRRLAQGGDAAPSRISGLPMRTAEGQLTKYSLARNLTEPEDCLSIHRLVQEIVVRFTATDEEERLRWEYAIELVNAYAPESAENTIAWTTWTLLSPHADALIERAKEYGVPASLQKLMNSYAAFQQYGSINYAGAAELFRKVLEVREKDHGPEALETLESVTNLGFLLYRKGDLAEAERLLARSLASREKVLGADHPDTLLSANMLGRLYLNQTKFAQCEVLFTRVLAGRTQAFGPRDTRTVMSMNNLGQLMMTKGDYATAEKFYRETLAIREAEGHSRGFILLTLTNLAFFLWRSGRAAEAEPYARRALAGREEMFNATHPSTLFSVNHLGLILTALDRLDEAEMLFRRALSGRKRLLGEDHHYTLLSLNDLAVLVGKKGDLLDAEDMLRRCLDLMEKRCGPADPDTLACASNLADVLAAKGEFAAAEPCYHRALQGYHQVFGQQHPVTAATQQKWDRFVGLRRSQSH